MTKTGSENTNKQLRTAIQQLAGTFGKEITQILFAEVVSVDAVKRTCTVKPVSGPADTNIEDVVLSPDRNDGELKIPSVGSTVVVAIGTEIGAFAFLWSDLDSITWKGGNFGGLAKIEKLTEKLNNLENIVNSLIAKYNAHIHPAIDSVTAAPVTVSPTVTQQTDVLTPTQKSDIENTTIKHGDK